MLDVGRVIGANLDTVVQIAATVERIVKLTRAGEGVAGEKHPRRVKPLASLDVGLLDVVGLGQDNEKVRTVESLDVELVVSGESHRIVAVVELPPGSPVHLTPQRDS